MRLFVRRILFSYIPSVFVLPAAYSALPIYPDPEQSYQCTRVPKEECTTESFQYDIPYMHLPTHPRCTSSYALRNLQRDSDWVRIWYAFLHMSIATYYIHPIHLTDGMNTVFEMLLGEKPPRHYHLYFNGLMKTKTENENVTLRLRSPAGSAFLPCQPVLALYKSLVGPVQVGLQLCS